MSSVRNIFPNSTAKLFATIFDDKSFLSLPTEGDIILSETISL